MRTIGASLQTHLGSGGSQLCRLFTITRVDGTVYRFTDLDTDLVFSGDTYLSSASMSITNISTGAQGGLTSTNARIVLDETGGITSIDIMRGRLDGATLKVSWVCWAHPSYGEIVILVGQLSVIEATNKGYGGFEVRGLLNRGDMRIGQFYTPECTADLGDARCTVDISTTIETGTIISTSTRTKMVASITGTPDDGYFSFGVLTWLSGANMNQSIEVLSQLATGPNQQLVLALEMPDDVEAGDTFEIVAGCNKQRTTCRQKFNNIANFRGYPFVPGSDAITDALI